MVSTFNAVIVAGCLLLFIVLNLDNLVRYHAGFSATSSRPEIHRRIAAPLFLAGIGTLAFFLESFLYVLLGFTKSLLPLFTFLGFGPMQTDLLDAFGLIVMVLGYAIFIWSLVARGQYATSWQMPVNHRLVDWGPYRYVRHPSYSGYFLMFIGFLLLWHNLLALASLVAIPSYVLITRTEEEMLVARFGERYRKYQKNVGRFLPKIRPRGPQNDQRGKAPR
jgi:protein-S-isoprenylcysteine O-methyltransferase Ste14